MPKGDPDPRLEPPTLDEVPALVAEGAARYNGGHYWHAHEAWEKAWHGLRAAGKREEAEFLQGLVFVTAAFENFTRGKPVGARRQLAKARGRLEGLRGLGAALGLVDEAGFLAALALAEAEPQPRAPRLVVRGHEGGVRPGE